MGKGDLLNYTSLGKVWASGRAAEWVFRRQADGMEPLFERQKDMIIRKIRMGGG